MTALLDVSALIALLDPQHSMHAEVADWFVAESGAGWSTCPVTENGFLRIVTGTRYTNPVALPLAWAALGTACQRPSHEFWPCDISVLERSLFVADRALTSAQITDIYLLGMAVRHQGTLLTLDRRISSESVSGASSRHLTVL
ncbi:MAG: hypothetical protein LBK72_07630 [Bifidobacteriaceae bacterium]|jgi:toxin-antitoxin system PIN domain toxin|nr:hypothetical protein [Bifidobacteriaceae bacterium]